jgi:hypothetical protein
MSFPTLPDLRTKYKQYTKDKLQKRTKQQKQRDLNTSLQRLPIQDKLNEINETDLKQKSIAELQQLRNQINKMNGKLPKNDKLYVLKNKLQKETTQQIQKKQIKLKTLQKQLKDKITDFKDDPSKNTSITQIQKLKKQIDDIDNQTPQDATLKDRVKHFKEKQLNEIITKALQKKQIIDKAIKQETIDLSLAKKLNLTDDDNIKNLTKLMIINEYKNRNEQDKFKTGKQNIIQKLKTLSPSERQKILNIINNETILYKEGLTDTFKQVDKAELISFLKGKINFKDFFKKGNVDKEAYQKIIDNLTKQQLQGIEHPGIQLDSTKRNLRGKINARLQKIKKDEKEKVKKIQQQEKQTIIKQLREDKIENALRLIQNSKQDYLKDTTFKEEIKTILEVNSNFLQKLQEGNNIPVEYKKLAQQQQKRRQQKDKLKQNTDYSNLISSESQTTRPMQEKSDTKQQKRKLLKELSSSSTERRNPQQQRKRKITQILQNTINSDLFNDSSTRNYKQWLKDNNSKSFFSTNKKNKITAEQIKMLPKTNTEFLKKLLKGKQGEQGEPLADFPERKKFVQQILKERQEKQQQEKQKILKNIMNFNKLMDFSKDNPFSPTMDENKQQSSNKQKGYNKSQDSFDPFAMDENKQGSNKQQGNKSQKITGHNVYDDPSNPYSQFR